MGVIANFVRKCKVICIAQKHFPLVYLSSRILVIIGCVIMKTVGNLYFYSFLKKHKFWFSRLFSLFILQNNVPSVVLDRSNGTYYDKNDGWETETKVTSSKCFIFKISLTSSSSFPWMKAAWRCLFLVQSPIDPT